MKSTRDKSTQEQRTRLIDFRQSLYENGFDQARDAQFELIDAVLTSHQIRSFAELSLSPLHRRQWSSTYAAIKTGEQDSPYLSQLFTHHLVVAT